MNIIIYSKNRGCQLELLLRSIKKYFKEWNRYNFNIIYKYSNNDYKKGYDKTFDIHKEDNFIFIKESDFKQDTVNSIDINEKYTVFFVDDNILKNYFSIEDDIFNEFINDNNILCLSLRLHSELNYCYPARIKMVKPNIINNKFKWYGETGDFGYPMSLDGHIFRTNEIYPLLYKLRYINPNSLEMFLSINPIRKEYMIMYDESIVINNPVNKVQDFNCNIHGNISSEFINEKYLDGYIINLDKYHKIKNSSCHQELDIEFIKD